MTSDELEQIEARAEDAERGPWTVDLPCFISIHGPGDSMIAELHNDFSDRNAIFIANARTDIPALCAEVRRLQAENAELAAIALVTGVAAVNGLKIDPATIPGAIEHYKENDR